MRHKSRTMFAALVAVVALGAVASASASAALPEFVPAKGVTWPLTVEGAIKPNGPEKIAFRAEDGLTPSVCESAKVKGQITGAKTASLTTEFESCHEARHTEVTCHAVGGKGPIVVSGSGSLVYLNKATKQVGIMLTVGETKAECLGGIIWKLKGTVISPITPINTETTKYELLYHEGLPGLEEYTTYENEKGEKIHTELKVSLGSGWASVSLEEGEALKLTASKSMKISA